jgi:hypothetical protein
MPRAARGPRTHKRPRDFQPGDTLVIWPARTTDPAALYDAEADLIRRLRRELGGGVSFPGSWPRPSQRSADRPYILTLEDPHRFVSSRIVSRLATSPTRFGRPQLRITKAGDGTVRRLLVGCAHYILGLFGPDSDLHRWGLTLTQRGGKSAKSVPWSRSPARWRYFLHRSYL